MPTFTPVPPSNRTNLKWKLNEPVIEGSPIWCYPGETFTLTITVEGTNAPSSPSATVYKGRTDVSATNMPTGSHSVSGQVITLKPFTVGVGNADYSVIVIATVAGNVENRKLVIQCIDHKAT